MTDIRFFTCRMGERLMDLRVRAGLTQDEVADRMGYIGPGRRSAISRLEKGLNGNPSLKMIAGYLRICGARWREFTDLLEQPDAAFSSTGQGANPISQLERLGLSDEELQNLRDATERQVSHYQARQPYRRGVAPAHPGRDREGAERFRSYRIVANIVELAVSDVLRKADISALRLSGYRAVGRAVLGVLWRSAQTEAARRELAAGELPDRARRKLAALGERWQELKLDSGIARQVQKAVVRRFRVLLESNPGLFPLRTIPGTQ